jgi:hypothetical protein
MTLAGVVLTSLLAASLMGCGADPKGTAVQQPPAAQALETRAANAVQQLTELLLKPWRKEIRALKEVEAAHAALLEQSRAGFVDRKRLEQDLAAPFPLVLEALQTLVPVADRMYSMDQHFRTLERGFRLPAGTTAPLVQRMGTLFYRARDEAWKLVNDGLDDLRQQKEATRFQLGLAQLGHTRAEGETLLKEMLTLAQHVDAVRALAPSMEQALKLAKQRVATLRSAANSQADALEANVRAVESALPDLQQRIEATALLLCSRPGDAVQVERDLRQEISGLANSLR